MSSTEQKSANRRVPNCGCLAVTVFVLLGLLGMCVSGEFRKERTDKELEAFRRRLVGTIWVSRGIMKDPRYLLTPYADMYTMTTTSTLTFLEDGKAPVRFHAEGVGGYTKNEVFDSTYSLVWGTYEGERQPIILYKLEGMVDAYVWKENTLIRTNTDMVEFRLVSSPGGTGDRRSESDTPQAGGEE